GRTPRRCPRRQRARARGSRRGRRWKDGAARLSRGLHSGSPRRPGDRRRIGDGARIRGPSSAVRAAARSPGAPPRAAAPGAENRVRAEPLGLVFAARETDEALAGLPGLEVSGLGEGDAQALLGSVIRVVLDERVRDRIVAETRGNPLALLELPRGLTATQLAGGFELLGAHALSGRIEESFQRRLEALSEQTR